MCKNNYKYLKRIIPTRVGTSTITQTVYTRCGDHPHACGDKHKIIIFCFIKIGSSPRVWGQEELRSFRFIVYRIIPTRVGTSDTRTLCVEKLQDHPHACGDKHFNQSFFNAGKGSSPRVWGQVTFIHGSKSC